MTDPLGHSVTAAYDAAGRLTSQTDRNGRVDSFTYDNADQLLTEVWNQSGVPVNTFSYSYDPNGNTLSATNSTGTDTFAYDALDRVTAQQDPFGVRVTTAYDAAGNRTLMQDSFGGVTSFLYDAADRLTSEQFGGTGQTPLRFDLTYTARDQLASVTRYSDLAGLNKVGSTAESYDSMGRVTNIQDQNGTGGILANMTYTWDTASRLTSETADGSTRTFLYDNANQLTSDGLHSYSYDLAGNRTMTGYGTGTENQMTASTDANGVPWTYAYDAEGNIVSKTDTANGNVWSYGYNNDNQLTGALEKNSGGTTLAQATYLYDAQGNPAEQDSYTQSAGSSTTRYSYDATDQLFADLSSTNSLQTRYLAGTGNGDASDQLFARISAGSAAWLLTDWQGSVRKVTDGTGTLQDTISYDGFGNITSETNSAAGGAYKYAGYRQDPITGQDQTGARFYDPTTGRWDQQDPAGFAAGDSNLYRYVGNNATNMTDPSGLMATSISPDGTGGMPSHGGSVGAVSGGLGQDSGGSAGLAGGFGSFGQGGASQVLPYLPGQQPPAEYQALPYQFTLEQDANGNWVQRDRPAANAGIWRFKFDQGTFPQAAVALSDPSALDVRSVQSMRAANPQKFDKAFRQLPASRYPEYHGGMQIPVKLNELQRAARQRQQQQAMKLWQQAVQDNPALQAAADADIKAFLENARAQFAKLPAEVQAQLKAKGRVGHLFGDYTYFKPGLYFDDNGVPHVTLLPTPKLQQLQLRQAMAQGLRGNAEGVAHYSGQWDAGFPDFSDPSVAAAWFAQYSTTAPSLLMPDLKEAPLEGASSDLAIITPYGWFTKGAAVLPELITNAAIAAALQAIADNAPNSRAAQVAQVTLLLALFAGRPISARTRGLFAQWAKKAGPRLRNAGQNLYKKLLLKLAPKTFRPNSVPVPKGYSRVYRAVSEAEYQDILATGRLRQGPNSLEGKWFADSPEGAQAHGKALFGEGKYRLVEVDVPNNAPSLFRDANLDRRGPATYLHNDDLPTLVPRPLE